MTPRQQVQALARQGGREFWRGLDELAGDPAAQDWLAAEFPSAFGGPVIGRREMLKVMAASLVMASLAGCGDEPEHVVPYVKQPVGFVPGQPKWFATAVPLDGYAQPVLAECHAGRPTRLDGNPEHPMSGGAISAFTQAAVLELYDPDRSGTVTHRGRISTWGEFEAALLKVGGQGLRLLTGPTSSPTLLRQIAALRAKVPGVVWHGIAGAPASFRRFDQAKVVVCLEDDPLGPGPMQIAAARAWAGRRGQGEGLPLLFVAESTPSLTGAQAHRRLAVASARMPLLAAGLQEGVAADFTPAERAWLDAAISAMGRFPGEAVVSIGGSAADPVIARPDAGLPELAEAIRSGQVGTLVMLDVNPAYTHPGMLDLARVPVTVHAGERYDETASDCQWHLPLTHPLESWSDARAVDGSVTILQPLMAPLHQGRTMHQILAGLLGQPGAEALGLVRETWGQLDEKAWRRALHDGWVEAEAAHLPIAPQRAPSSPTRGEVLLGSSIEIVFRNDPTIWDGRFANCGWLQELPKPLTKVVWENVIALSPALAQRQGVENGALVEVAVGERRVQGPAWILPGQAENTVTLTLGYGRRKVGRVGDGLGYDAYPLLAAKGAVSLRKLGGMGSLATTQQHHAIDGDGLIQVVAPHQGVRAAETTLGHPDRPSLYPHRPPGDPAWGMVIDLDLCIGCNACVVACQAENNIPVVGKAQVAAGREMAWLRIDRYYQGPPDDPLTHFQPVPCMHCENAPCELGCPVNATVHGPDGVNEMVYNRCIGTRTCATYCPYKVRRFNFLDYGRKAAPLETAQRNPEVTVRARGVMEKCTYCIQRIETARIAAAKDNRPIGPVKTACQTTCPTGAIIFGNLAEADSGVSQSRASPRNYGLLDELNTWPRTTYLARIREGEDG